MSIALVDGDQCNANELELPANRYLRPRIIARFLIQASKELLGDSSVSTVMLMVHRLGECGSGCTEPINTNRCVCSVMPSLPHGKNDFAARLFFVFC